MSAFYLVAVYLLAAVVAVPLAKRLGLGSILGYLLAGTVIGPYVLGLVGESSHGVMHIAEFGVVMMLFLIGLELRPALLWQLRRTILGLGGCQVGGTALVITAVALACSLSWKASLAIGLVLAMSSTAIALQSLGEKGQLKTPGGEASFSILLFQDIAVIPVITLMPLLADLPKSPRATDHSAPGAAALGSLPGWQQTLLVLGAIAGLVFAGRYVAATRLRELFTAATLLLVVAIVLLMQKVGLSPALGTFLAGVLLPDSEYRVQLETDLEPFKGLLLGLFFISVGATIDFSLVASKPGIVALLVAALIAVKLGVLYSVGRLFRLEPGQGWLLAFALAQGGEFAFVLFSYATQQSVLHPGVANLLVAAVALSMATAPLLLLLHDRVVLPRFQIHPVQREPDAIDEHDNPVILAGFGRFGHIVGRLLRASGIGTTVLDHDPDQVELLRRFGLKSFYGDASRLDLLHAAGAERARLFILAIDDEEKARQIVKMVQKQFPNLKILARAISRQHAYDLLNLGVPEVFRETLGSALDLGVAALRSVGMDDHRAHRAAQLLREHDEASVRDMARLDSRSEVYVSRAHQHSENLLRALQSDEVMLSRSPQSPGTNCAASEVPGQA
jgi:glutathione-regulated potassium-efflux system ancillary protein KefC